MSEERCKKTMRPADPWGRYPNTCSRKTLRDGYCKQHHPDATAARRKKRDNDYAEAATNRRRNRNREKAKQTLMDALLDNTLALPDAALAAIEDYRNSMEK